MLTYYVDYSTVGKCRKVSFEIRCEHVRGPFVPVLHVLFCSFSPHKKEEIEKNLKYAGAPGAKQFKVDIRSQPGSVR